MKKIRSWSKYKKIKFAKMINQKINCNVCGENFKVTFNENIKQEECLIHIKSKLKFEKRKGFFAFLFNEACYERDVYEQVTKCESCCPNCDTEKELFLISYNPKRTIKTKWKETGYRTI